MNNVLVAAFNTAGTSSLNRHIHHSTTTHSSNYQQYHRTRKSRAFIARSATSGGGSSSEEEIDVSSPQYINTNAMNRSTTATITDDTGYSDSNDNTDITEELTKEEILSKKEISVSASIVLPFQADIAFSAFADLPRQPTWSNWLHSVDYIDDNDDNDKKQTNIPEIDGIPLRETKWVMRWKKAFRFSWNSRVTNIVRPSLIEWESTSGLQNMGKIEFTERNGNGNDNEDGTAGVGVATDMVLTMKFIAPRIVASMMRRSDVISTFMEEKMLMPTLTNFRQIVMEQDLGMNMDMNMNAMNMTVLVEEFEV